MKWMIGLSFLGYMFLHHTEAACNFPSDWTGTWVHSLHGTVTLTTTTMQLSQYPDGPVTLNCDTLVNSKYLVASELFNETNGNSVYLVGCLEITQLKTNLYKIIHRTLEDGKAFNYRYLQVGSLPTIDEATLCTDSTSDPDTEYFLMMKSGEISNVKINAPAPFLGTLAYTFDGNKCSGNTGSASACTDNTLIDIDYTSCSDVVGYSTSGHLNVIYSVESSGTYTIWTYNQDATVDNTATFLFTCFVASYSGSQIEATQNPQFCDATQTNTTAASNGKNITGTLTDSGSSDGSNSGNNSGSNSGTNSGSNSGDDYNFARRNHGADSMILILISYISCVVIKKIFFILDN